MNIIYKSITRILGRSPLMKKKLWNLLEKSFSQSYRKGGEGEILLLQRLEKINEAPIVIDVGANVGRWSEEVRTIMPKSTIYAIEPIPEFFSQISNDTVNEKYNLALSDERGTLTVYQSGGGGKPFKKQVKGKKSKEHKIPSITGDEFVSKNVPDSIDLIKIDTDGYDYEVLIGLAQTIEKQRPFVQFEVSHWWLRMGYTLTQAVNFFSKRGYVCRVLTDNGLEHIGETIPDYLFITANIVAIPENKLDELLE